MQKKEVASKIWVYIYQIFVFFFFFLPMVPNDRGLFVHLDNSHFQMFSGLEIHAIFFLENMDCTQLLISQKGQEDNISFSKH